MENSLEDVRRKFNRTYCFAGFEDGNRWAFVDGISDYDKTYNTCTGLVFDFKEKTLQTINKDPVICSFKPLYKLPEQRYYETDIDTPSTLFRKASKSYKVGISHDAWQTDVYLESIKLNKPLEFDPVKSLETKGLVTPKIRLTKSTVYYLGIDVGMRKGNKFLVNDWILQEIKDAFRGQNVQIL